VTRLVVTGTGTDIGKTIVTAAIAALAADAGRSVRVVKPVQTGVADGAESDVDVVRRLTGLADVHELVRYAEPLAPASAARRQGAATVSIEVLAERIQSLGPVDLLLVEGAGGLLVQLDEDGGTIADVAHHLGANVLSVAAAGLGTLNAVALTAEALHRRGLGSAGVVIGEWPAEPGLAERCNLDDLPRYAGAPLLGAVPAAAGSKRPDEFLELARRALSPSLGGSWSLDTSAVR
jgi:dethiobiotin synthetase